jgi:hypothetical protein
MVKIAPRVFTGEQDSSGNVEDPQTWLNHFNKVSISNGWNTDAVKGSVMGRVEEVQSE